ncbi:MAG: ribonuclease HIII [Mycoplasma sp.]|nr:ribonuclease HIII [Mycoplasma sp.]
MKYENLDIIGADETGVGDYLTPLVAAAAFVPKENIEYFKKIGITDSKKLTDKKMLELYEKIKNKIKSRTRWLDQEQYNSMNKKFNAHELKTFLHIKAISSLEESIKVDKVIIDEYASQKNMDKYFNHLKEVNIPNLKTPIILIKRAEMVHISVAVASIIARVKLIELMKEQNKKWEMHFPLGTNDRSKNAARDFIKKFGVNNLGKIAKLSFKTTKELTN